jgi:catechol 2,3-dioxygenase-like lactoylglutathione lyase family enzyme
MVLRFRVTRHDRSSSCVYESDLIRPAARSAWAAVAGERVNRSSGFPRGGSRAVHRLGGVRIHQLTLATNNSAEQIVFWAEVLELPVRESGDGAIEVHLLESVIRFEQVSADLDPRYHFAINVPCNAIEAAAAWIGERHDLLAFHGDPDEQEGAVIVHTDRGASAFYFLDGGGNVVELIANPYLDNHSNETFGPDSFLEIAEIGLATDETVETSGAIQEALGADVLWGGREGWSLTAIGDDHGVVIVAPTGRGWIPIGLPAKRLPTTIVASGPRFRETTLAEGPYHIRAVETP